VIARGAAAKTAIRRWVRWRLSTRIVLTQLGVLLVVVALGLWLNLRLAQDRLNEQYEYRSLAVAQTVANMPQTIDALSGTGPVSVVQPIALTVTRSTGAAFVVVVNRDGIRLSSPDPSLVGKWFHEAVVSLDGRDHLRIDPGKPAPSANARAPVFGAGGKVVGEVSVGFLEGQVTAAAWHDVPALAAAAGIALLVGVVASVLLARRLKRITHGLELEEITGLLGEVRQMADEQESLRRVGVAVWGRGADELEVGARYQVGGHNVATMVLATGRPARVDDRGSINGEVASVAATLGFQSAVGTPIAVDGRVWGLVTITTSRPEPMPADTEQRVTGFTELVATAITNAQARADLTASRRRVVSAADDMRRRIERNLHDGTQQRIVALALELRAIKEDCPEQPELESRLSRAMHELAGLHDELREISRGLHPAILSQAGLVPAMNSLARRAALPVKLNVDVPGRLPEPVEVAAYYVVSEALANAAKHSGATTIHVDVAAHDDLLHVGILDNGAGGAIEADGSGIVGLRDRVEALGGTMLLVSPPGEGTAIRVELPLDHV
jgi:signal transduction histidine kinase